MLLAIEIGISGGEKTDKFLGLPSVKYITMFYWPERCSHTARKNLHLSLLLKFAQQTSVACWPVKENTSLTAKSTNPGLLNTTCFVYWYIITLANKLL